jgi:hypothetical protein
VYINSIKFYHYQEPKIITNMGTLTQVYNFRLHLHNIILQRSGISIYIAFNDSSEAVWSYDLISRLVQKCTHGVLDVSTCINTHTSYCYYYIITKRKQRNMIKKCSLEFFSEICDPNNLSPGRILILMYILQY